MKKQVLSFLLLLFSVVSYAQAPANDNVEGAITIQALNSCSENAAYTTVNATPDQRGPAVTWDNATGADVWFKFTALRSDVNINVNGGNVNGNGTLVSPLIGLYQQGTNAAGEPFLEDLIGIFVRGTDVSSFYKGGLTAGNTYYIRVAGSNAGTFKLCINNYTPPLRAGQDCSTASLLCGTQPFTQTDVTGAGANARESVGTCLDASPLSTGPIEANSAWYRWEAAVSGPLTFVITPTNENDDIDWVLYDVGMSYDCSNINSSTAIRCASGSGVTCNISSGRYNKTGLSLTSTDLTEMPGCIQGQDGFVKYVDLIAGHQYALLVNNFSSGNNGFKIEFSGLGQLAGPKPDFTYEIIQPCEPTQSYRFTNKSSNYTSLKWTFGEGASIPSATGNGPFDVVYATTGTKTVVLEATSAKGCLEVKSATFDVSVKPTRPNVSITNSRPVYCLNETLELNATPTAGASYAWTGPNGFTATGEKIRIRILNYNQAGTYTVVASIGPCSSEPASITIPAIGQTPVVDFTVTPNNLCDPATQSFTITSTAADFTTIKWDFGTGASTATATTNGSFTIRYSTPGTKTISVTAIGSSGCTVTAQKTIDVPVKPATPILSRNKEKFCFGDDIILSAPAQQNATYAWTGPNNFTATTPTVNIKASGVNQSGNYRLVVTQGICSSEPATIAVEVIPIPKPSFTTIPSLPAKLGTPVTVTFTNTSTDADAYVWNFGDGSTSTELSPNHTYTRKGDFTVQLTATNKDYCSVSILKGTLVVREGAIAFVPNTFTPNGDGINDELVVTITNLKSYSFNLYNRYGTKLFETRDIFVNWNGTYRNSPVPAGVYYYVINGVNLDGENVQKSGSVTVIR